jgi:site-specific recombinase XerD
MTASGARSLEAVPPPAGEIEWQAAVDAFLRRDITPGTRRLYDLTLRWLGGQVGTATPLRTITPQRLAQALLDAYPDASAASWNRHVATARSFASFTHRQGWTDRDWAWVLERRRERLDRTRTLTAEDVARLLDRRDFAMRERALWSLLSETAARAEEVLQLNVEDVDLTQRRARTTRKGGDIEYLYFATRSARLLPKLIASRTSGPLFLADRAPAPSRVPAQLDLDPVSGRARLSYRRAAELFKNATGVGLHQLRHAAITDLAEKGVPITLLMAKSGHQSLRTLQRYAKPSPEAVARLTAEHDPLRRR